MEIYRSAIERVTPKAVKLTAAAFLGSGVLIAGSLLSFGRTTGATNEGLLGLEPDSPSAPIEPEVDNEPAKIDALKRQGFSVYDFPLLGITERVAVAGIEGLVQRDAPAILPGDDVRNGYLQWGECLRWDKPEKITLNPDGTRDIFGKNFQGYWRLNHTDKEGKVTWFIESGHSNCNDLTREAPRLLK